MDIHFTVQLEPQLVYAHPRLVLTAGIHLPQRFLVGRDIQDLSLFGVKSGTFALINGALEGNVLLHRFIEPYMMERK